VFSKKIHDIFSPIIVLMLQFDKVAVLMLQWLT